MSDNYEVVRLPRMACGSRERMIEPLDAEFEGSDMLAAQDKCRVMAFSECSLECVKHGGSRALRRRDVSQRSNDENPVSRLGI